MNLFLDTNVMVGFIFETDKWNSKSIEVVQHWANKYSCHYARDECHRKYNSKLQKIIREFRYFHKELRLAKAYTDVETYVQNGNFVTKHILMKFLAANKHNTLKKTVEVFSEFKTQPEIRCNDNYNYILDAIIFHTSRTPHKEVADKLQAHGLLAKDADDFEIIIDAHDLALIVMELFFITGDYTDVVSNKELILSATSISDIVGLGEFSYN